MRLADLFPVEDVIVPFEPGDKWDAIRKLVAHLVDRGRIARSEAPAIVDAVLARERSMSTGMEHGIAIPHAAVEGIDELVAVLALAPDGIPFEAVDRQPARILVGLVIPRHKKLLHIKTLAEVARLLARAEVRQRLLRCTDRGDVVATLAELDGAASR